MKHTAKGIAIQYILRRTLRQHSVINEHHIVCIPGQHGKIMGGHQNGKVIILPQLVQHIHEGFHSLHIHTGKGLIQNQDIGNGIQCQCQQHSLQLTTGECTDPLVDQFLPMNPLQTGAYMAAHLLAQSQKSRPAAHATGKKIGYGHRIAGIEGRTLGNITDDRFPIPSTGHREGYDTLVFPLTQHGFQKGALTGAVWPNERHNLTAVQM